MVVQGVTFLFFAQTHIHRGKESFHSRVPARALTVQQGSKAAAAMSIAAKKKALVDPYAQIALHDSAENQRVVMRDQILAEEKKGALPPAPYVQLHSGQDCPTSCPLC